MRAFMSRARRFAVVVATVIVSRVVLADRPPCAAHVERGDFGIVQVDAATGTFVDSRGIVRSRGTNVYSLRYDFAGGASAQERAISVLDALSELELDVVRTWAFMDGDREDYDGRAMQPSEGEFIEKNFVALDRLLCECAFRRIRVILTLTNHWDDYGGIQKYVEWARASGSDVYRREDFFTSPHCRASFERFIAAVVNRVNTHDNLSYRDHPAIFSYQLMNEPRIPGDDSGSTFHDWVSHFASFVRRIDGARHLISVGTEGFFLGSSELATSANPFSGAERQGVDMNRLNDVNDIDYVTIHCWVDDWMDSDDESKYRFLQTYIRAQVSSARAKPIILEEFGKHRPLPIRDRFFRRVYELLREDGRNPARSGSLFWLFVPADVEDYDGFSVYSTDESTLAIVKEDAKSFVVGPSTPPAASAPPVECCEPPRQPDGDEVSVEFETYDGGFIGGDGESLISYSTTMFSSNSYDAHATYGDYVSIEFVIKTKIQVNADIDFAGVQDTMTLTSTSVSTSIASAQTQGDVLTLSFSSTRRLGQGGNYIDEGPIDFTIYVTLYSATSVEYVVKNVTHGTRIVFDSAAPYITDAFLRPYTSQGDIVKEHQVFSTVAFGDIAVLYVAFSEPVGAPKVKMNGREAFVSLATAHSTNSFYAFVEITPENDVLGSDVTFEVVEAADYAGNKCFTCSDDLSKLTTDGSLLRVVAGGS